MNSLNNRRSRNKGEHVGWMGIAAIAVMGLSSFALSRYLRIEPQEIVALAALILMTLLGTQLRKAHAQKMIKPIEVVVLSLVATLFDVSLVLGYHIVITEDTYYGLVDENYISPYNWTDPAAFALMLPGLVIIALGAFYALKITASKRKRDGEIDLSPLPWKGVLACAAAMVLAWIPYLLVYWPGFIFGDTTTSISQALSLIPYTNHHPFAYTVFIKCCLWLGRTVGAGNTGGCVIYCILQMAFMAMTFAYLSFWIVRRARIKTFWAIVTVVFFALSPYIATYSIAMWKDPIFSAALVVISLMLLDIIWTGGDIIRAKRSFLPMFSVFALIVILMRNNGIYIMALVVCALIILMVAKRRTNLKNLAVTSCLVAALIAAGILITGPLYKSMGVTPSPTEESLAIPINQMARVAALDGDMTQDDAAYLDSLLPLDEYRETYRPCVVDKLKWDEHFNASALNEGFFEHWISMLLRNPRTYFEAWELQTFGYWAINEPVARDHTNIWAGIPRNIYTEYAWQLDEYGVDTENLLGSDIFRDVFPFNNRSVPISVILWVLVYLTACLALSRRGSWVVGLIPSLGLLFTLLIATPTCYWPRYAAAVQFMIPMYAMLFAEITNRTVSSPTELPRSSAETSI